VTDTEGEEHLKPSRLVRCTKCYKHILADEAYKETGLCVECWRVARVRCKKVLEDNKTSQLQIMIIRHKHGDG
jgi:hypothetical protein